MSLSGRREEDGWVEEEGEGDCSDQESQLPSESRC